MNNYFALAQQTQNICITFVQCRLNLFDIGPTLYKSYRGVDASGGELSHCLVITQWTSDIGPVDVPRSQQTQNICIKFIQCQTNVEDVGPTLYICYINVLCLLDWDCTGGQH